MADDKPSCQPWVEKYRPQSVDDVLSHKDIIQTIVKLIDANKMPHLLLYGPAGTGKTSTIHACARRMYGNRIKHNVLELNASDDRGIGTIRGQIKEFASTQMLFAGAGFGGASGKGQAFKLVVLDEADQLTNDAQSALRRVMEQFSRNVRFVVICNHVNKMMPAIQSRCTRFRFGPLPKKAVLTRLREVAGLERTEFNEAALVAVYKLSNGDMRKALNIMQGCAMSFTKRTAIGEEDVYDATGSPSPATVRAIMEMLVNRPVKEAAAGLREAMAEKGLALSDVVRELHHLLMKMDLAAGVRCWAVEQLSDLEYQLAFTCSDELQISGLVGMMQLVRASTTDERSIDDIVVASAVAQ